MIATGPDRAARRTEQDDARAAAERAELLREELTRARIELEMHQRHGASAAVPSDAGTASRAPLRRSTRRNQRGLAVGVWFVAFYLLLAILAGTSHEVTRSTVHEPEVVGSAVVGSFAPGTDPAAGV